jgi:diguanylate cyclase (GGDEF)-like protein/PAS domain S-box-containing protein
MPAHFVEATVFIKMLWRVMIGRRQPARPATEWIVFAAGMLSSLFFLGYLIVNERHTAETTEAERLRSQAIVIGESLSRQLEGIRSGLLSARASFTDPSCDAVCRSTLFQALKRSMPGVRALLAMQPDGAIILSDDDLGDRHLDDQIFKRDLARICNGNMMYLSEPYENEPNSFNIKVAMSLNHADRCGAGVVVMILNPEYFDAVMRSALYADDMHVAITDNTGQHLLYVPPDPAQFRTPRPASDGKRRLLVERPVSIEGLSINKKLTISLSRLRSRIDMGWIKLGTTGGAVWLAFWLICGAGLLAAQRRNSVLHELKRAAEAERAESAERVELALNGGDLGLWDLDVVRDALHVDARACAMLGYSENEQDRNQAAWLANTHPEDADRVLEELARHVRGETSVFEAEFRLRHRNGNWVWMQSRGKAVSRDANGQALRVMGTRSNITARKAAEAEIAHLAFYDGLTNLPNRRLLLDRLGHAIAKSDRNESFGAVLFVDLDNFKDLNDTLGHDMGDRLLEIVAYRLLQVTREADTVARLGGDEFVILLEDLSNSGADAVSSAEMVAHKVLNTLNLTYTLDGNEVRSTPSIGVVMFGGQGKHTISDLLRHADMAMYEAKAAGRATFRFFDPGMKATLDINASLESELRLALMRDQFRLYYQPVVNNDGVLTGVEALIRWYHPKTGVISPSVFIELAEKTGLIIDIGEWVLEAACAQLAEWRDDPRSAHLTMAVNVSARQLRQENFPRRVLDIVARTGANPHSLKLELTESMLLSDVEDTITKMTLLKQSGIGFSLDDFGTGYSSLSYLQRLPLDQLKIDQSFVRDMLNTHHAASIVEAIAKLGSSLDLGLVAEGVETLAQWTRLRELGCGLYQGYLFAPPLPLEHFTEQYLPDVLATA